MIGDGALLTRIGNKAQANVPRLGCLFTDVAHVFNFETALVQERNVVEHGIELRQQHALFDALQVTRLLFWGQMFALEPISNDDTPALLQQSIGVHQELFFVREVAHCCKYKDLFSFGNFAALVVLAFNNPNKVCLSITLGKINCLSIHFFEFN
jgi:hypothetical protein